jgi:hypothetical protein
VKVALFLADNILLWWKASTVYRSWEAVHTSQKNTHHTPKPHNECVERV